MQFTRKCCGVGAKNVQTQLVPSLLDENLLLFQSQAANKCRVPVDSHTDPYHPPASVGFTDLDTTRCPATSRRIFCMAITSGLSWTGPTDPRAPNQRPFLALRSIIINY